VVPGQGREGGQLALQGWELHLSPLHQTSPLASQTGESSPSGSQASRRMAHSEVQNERREGK